MSTGVVRLQALAAACLLGVAIGQPAQARGQLQAGPTLVELAPGLTAGRLTLSNTGDMPVAAQVRAFRWSQVDGEDRLAPSNDLALSPAIVKIAPGASQVVRVVRQGAAPMGQDATYRIVVDELPPPADAAPVPGINLRMRYVVPVYLRVANATPPQLACELHGTTLDCRNSGGQSAQLGATRLTNGRGGVAALSQGLFGYVLPGSRRQWALNAALTPALFATGLRLETQLNGQSAAVPIQRAP